MSCKYQATSLLVIENTRKLMTVLLEIFDTFWYCENMYDNVLGIMPLSQYFSVPPVIVKVLPDPVYKLLSIKAVTLQNNPDLSVCKDCSIVTL